MAAPGTAPRRVRPGVWVTASGRQLSEAGSAWWENHFRAGNTDGRGHVAHPSLVDATKPVLPTVRPAGTSIAGQRGRSGATEQEWRQKTPPQKMNTPLAVWDQKTRRTYAVPVGFGGATSIDRVVAARQAARAAEARAKAAAAPPDIRKLTAGPQTRATEYARLSRQKDTGLNLGALGRIAAAPFRAAGQELQDIGVGIAQSAHPTGGRDPQQLERAHNLAPRIAERTGEWTVGPAVAKAIMGGHPSAGALGVDAALMLPFLRPLRGARAITEGARVVAEGERTGAGVAQAARGGWQAGLRGNRAFRTIRVGDRDVQIPSRSQNIISQHLLDRPADWVSSRFPNVPVAGARARAFRHQGREEADEIRRGRVAVQKHIDALPDKNSNEDVAHFWWAQLPVDMRNTEGLGAVRNRLQSDLDNLAQGPAPEGLLRRADQPQKIKDLSATIKRLDEVIAAKPQLDQKAIDAIDALSSQRKDILQNTFTRDKNGNQVPLLNPETATDREQLVTRWLSGATFENPTAAKLGKPSANLLRRRNRVARMQSIYDKAVERSAKAVEASRTPLTRAEAAARLDELESQMERHIDETAAKLRPNFGTKEAQAETRLRNIERAKWERQQTGKTKAGRASGAVSGEKVRERPLTLIEEHRKQTIADLENLAERRPKDMEGYIRLRDEIASLRRSIQETEAAPIGEREWVKGEAGRRQATRNLYDPRVTRLGGALSVAKDELEVAEKAAQARIKPTGVIGGEPREGAGQIFIGHRQDTPGLLGTRIRRPSVGPPRAPKGTRKLNKMELLSSGRVRQSTHVAAEDWAASQTYRDSRRIRDRLVEMGDRMPQVEGEIPNELPHGYDDYLIVNPHGDTVPRGWKTDRLAKLMEGGGGDELHDGTRQVLESAFQDPADWENIVREAKATGVADDLRLIPKKEVERFYRQFVPMDPGTIGGKGWDKVIDGVAASLIFGRLGYIPKNVAQNLVMSVPHQGVRLFGNAARAAQLSPGNLKRTDLEKEIWDLAASEVGGGSAGSVSKEAATQVLGGAAQFMTGVADTPLRVSALIHEMANRGVISKWSSKLSEADQRAMLDFLQSPDKRMDLNEAMQTAKDAMADFDRMNPTQRKWARRFLIVPGWLAAGTRYPAKMVTSYPGRTAAIGYAAAGEPGLPEDSRLKNRPAWDYLKPGLPSFLQGVETGKNQLFRTSSLFPASIPADIGFALAQGHPLKAYDYANPAIGAVEGLARSQVETSSGESKNVPFFGGRGALWSNVQRLMPSEKFIEDMIQGPSGTGLYPTKSRWERTKRELGVFPTKYDPDVAARMRASERGQTQTAKALGEKMDFEKALTTAGYHMDPETKKAWETRVERYRRNDGINAVGLDYQQKAYRNDIAYAKKLGLISAEDAKSYLSDLEGASEEQIKSARRGMTEEWFGGDIISEAKQQLKDATGG